VHFGCHKRHITEFRVFVYIYIYIYIMEPYPRPCHVPSPLKSRPLTCTLKIYTSHSLCRVSCCSRYNVGPLLLCCKVLKRNSRGENHQVHTANHSPRATSHPRLKACDHCKLRALIGRRGWRSSKFTSHM
jgi:hypothetical protein